MKKMYFDGQTENGSYIQNAMIIVPEDETMNQIVTAIKEQGYSYFKLDSMRKLVKI